MSSLRARADNGRLLLDEPTDLPDGLELDLVVDDQGEALRCCQWAAGCAGGHPVDLAP